MQESLVREQMQRRRAELVVRARQIGADLRREASPVEGGFADQATQLVNEPVLESIGISAEQELQQIDAALGRLAEGRYGRCEICDGPIAAERLTAVPYATTCVKCAT